MPGRIWKLRASSSAQRKFTGETEGELGDDGSGDGESNDEREVLLPVSLESEFWADVHGLRRQFGAEVEQCLGR